MGNLRQSMTTEEWDSMEKRMKEDAANGKPDRPTISLSLYDMTLSEMRELRVVLRDFYSDYELMMLDKWIAWKTYKNNDKAN